MCSVFAQHLKMPLKMRFGSDSLCLCCDVHPPVYRYEGLMAFVSWYLGCLKGKLEAGVNVLSLDGLRNS